MTGNCDGGFCADTGLKVQLDKNNPIKPTDAWLENNIRVVNTGTDPVPLEEITVRYWFTIDGPQQLLHPNCLVADPGCENVIVSYTPLDPARPGADYYVEYGFDAAAGNLLSSDPADFEINSQKDDWQDFDENDDYSYGTPMTYTDWPQITAYRNGVLVWGLEPGTCSDGLLNQDETDIDCGGTCSATCQPGDHCVDADDCESLVCTANVCAAPTCSDGIKNQDEVGVDCGGVCSACV